ncbi:MAG TPA: DUF1302 domain-containing protein [Gammaproteobacteria bacterium]|nr:DUF1302 domain-containing protein [Gammaproteobacteria bacterium]
MKNHKDEGTVYRWCGATLAFAVVSTLGLAVPQQAAAVEFNNGDWSGSLDTTLSYGARWRIQGRDPRLLGLAGTPQAGTAFSVNGDDGNQNYDKGVVNSAVKVTSELELNHKSNNGGAFIRVSGFYDNESENGNRVKAPLSNDALDLVGSKLDLLDAYVWGRFSVGGKDAQLRLGNQILNWGESTFIQNGINAINPVDVAALRVPGAELREALVPVPLISTSVDITDNANIEAFYQLQWQETKIDPTGSYFSTNDFAGQGGTRVVLGFGSVPDILPSGPSAPPIGPVGAVVPRDPNRYPKDGGQYGLAYHVTAPSLNDTEFGLFYLNYHSRLPIISARSGVLGPTVDPRTGKPAGLLAGDYAGSAGYLIEYPENIQLFGASFNTTLNDSGVALQGEVSLHKNVPLQVDDAELLFAALSPLALIGSPAGQLLAATNQVVPGGVGFNTYIPGYIRRDVTQIQATATKLFSHVLGADQFVLLGEAAMDMVSNMPDKSVLRLDGPGTYTSGNPIHASIGAHAGKPAEDASHFPDANSWGYRIAGRLDYLNAVAGANISPRFSFQHDVSGISPGPGGNFIEGRKALTLGVATTWQQKWVFDISYTKYSGAGRYNLINDRDFIAASIKYSF